MLMSNIGRVFTKKQIYENVWQEEYLGDDNTIIVHISHLRDKIEEDPKNPLSDERIGEILKEHLKVNIARRTVAKYRMAMDIPSSSRRKAHF